MQDRDTETLTWIGEMYGVRMPVLEALMARADGAGGALSRWGVRNQVDRWIDMRLAVKIDRPGGDWITLTKAGLKLAGLETLKPWGVPASGMAHTHAAAVVRLAVERQRGPGVWTCERKLRIVRGEKGHVLDGIVLTKDNRWRGIEVELTVKSWQRYADEVVAKLPGDVSELMYLVRDDPMRIRVTDRLNTAIQHIGRKVDWSVRVLPEVVGVPYIRQPSKRYKAMVGAP
jgi:hypothetical protein